MDYNHLTITNCFRKILITVWIFRKISFAINYNWILILQKQCISDADDKFSVLNFLNWFINPYFYHIQFWHWSFDGLSNLYYGNPLVTHCLPCRYPIVTHSLRGRCAVVAHSLHWLTTGNSVVTLALQGF